MYYFCWFRSVTSRPGGDHGQCVSMIDVVEFDVKLEYFITSTGMSLAVYHWPVAT